LVIALQSAAAIQEKQKELELMVGSTSTPAIFTSQCPNTGARKSGSPAEEETTKDSQDTKIEEKALKFHFISLSCTSLRLCAFALISRLWAWKM
jgi:hypothetical protein